MIQSVIKWHRMLHAGHFVHAHLQASSKARSINATLKPLSNAGSSPTAYFCPTACWPPSLHRPACVGSPSMHAHKLACHTPPGTGTQIPSAAPGRKVLFLEHVTDEQLDYSTETAAVPTPHLLPNRRHTSFVRQRLSLSQDRKQQLVALSVCPKVRHSHSPSLYHVNVASFSKSVLCAFILTCLGSRPMLLGFMICCPL